MFWIVAASTAFCAITLVDVLRCVATDQYQDQWTFGKNKITRAALFTLSPRKQSRTTMNQLRNIWSLLGSLRHIPFTEFRRIKTASTRLLGSIRKILCPWHTRIGIISDIVCEMERGSDPLTTHGRTINVECYIKSISSLSFQEVHRYEGQHIYDIQFSPDEEWVVVCATGECHAIHVSLR